MVKQLAKSAVLMYDSNKNQYLSCESRRWGTIVTSGAGAIIPFERDWSEDPVLTNQFCVNDTQRR
jgi:hypothetical protein